MQAEGVVDTPFNNNNDPQHLQSRCEDSIRSLGRWQGNATQETHSPKYVSAEGSMQDGLFKKKKKEGGKMTKLI